MKRFTKICAFILIVAAAWAASPRQAAAWPIGNIDDPSYSYGVSTGTTVDLSTTSPSTPVTTICSVSQSLTLFRNLEIVAILQGNTGGAMDLYVQSSPDGGTTWADYIHYPQQASGGGPQAYHVTVGRDGGQTAAPVVISTGITPSLAVNTVVGGSFGNFLRVVIKSGAGTTVGKAQFIKIYAGI